MCEKLNLSLSLSLPSSLPLSLVFSFTLYNIEYELLFPSVFNHSIIIVSIRIVHRIITFPIILLYREMCGKT